MAFLISKVAPEAGPLQVASTVTMPASFLAVTPNGVEGTVEPEVNTGVPPAPEQAAKTSGAATADARMARLFMIGRSRSEMRAE